MSLTCGFYNSFNHDRKYNAIQISSIFDGIVNDGIFMSIGDRFEVTANGEDMFVTVGPGRAWFDHTWTLNDAPLLLEIPQSEVILNRYDAIVLEVNSDVSVRDNVIKVLSGTPATEPTYPELTNTSTIHQYPLAYVYVEKNTESIRQANITSMIGKDTTPYVTGIIETIDIESMVAQWEDQWKEFLENGTSSWEDWFSTYTTTNSEEFNNWMLGQKDFFSSWFEEIKDQLSSDQAGNLQLQINDVRQELNTSTKWFGFKLKVLTKEEYQRLVITESVDPLTFYWCPKNSEDVQFIYDALKDAYGDDILDSSSDPIIGRSIKI